MAKAPVRDAYDLCSEYAKASLEYDRLDAEADKLVRSMRPHRTITQDLAKPVRELLEKAPSKAIIIGHRRVLMLIDAEIVVRECASVFSLDPRGFDAALRDSTDRLTADVAKLKAYHLPLDAPTIPADACVLDASEPAADVTLDDLDPVAVS